MRSAQNGGARICYSYAVSLVLLLVVSPLGCAGMRWLSPAIAMRYSWHDRIL
jgi:hypothetical protein